MPAAVVAVALGPSLAGCCDCITPEDLPRFDEALAEDLDRTLLVTAAQLDAPGAVLGVEDPQGSRWIGAAGFADPEAGMETRPGDRFRIGSITKTFTAAAILLLVADGDVSLDDTVDDWLPGLVPDGDQVTIELLLQHRSGIRSYTDTAWFVAHMTEEVTPERIVEESVAEGAEFAPGTSWAYSNTNYILLGMITELATGRAWHEVARDRLIEPWGLTDTYLEAHEDGGAIVRGHLGGVEVTDAYHASWGWTSGGLVSTAAVLLTWWDAVLVGHVVDDERLSYMLTDPTGAGYGAGMYLLERDEGRYVGHTGSTQGFQSDLFRLEGAGWTVTSLVNDFAVEASDRSAAAWAVLNEE